MKQLPEGWEGRCIREALNDAGFQYTERAGQRGAPIAGYNYGPDRDSQLHISVQVAPGAMRFTADRFEAEASPHGDNLSKANDATIDWGAGRLFWNPDPGRFEAAITVFAYPDYVPDPALVQFVSHHLWEQREALGQLRAPQFDPAVFGEPSITLEDVVACFAEAGFRLQGKPDGSYITRLDTGDEGTAGMRFSMDRPGILAIDALCMASPTWPAEPEYWLKMNDLNACLMSCAVTRWTDQIVIRNAMPTAWIPDHPQWPGLMFDHATWASLDVARIGAGGPVARPGAP